MKKYLLPTLLSFVFVLSSFVSHAQAPAKGDTIDLPPAMMCKYMTSKLSNEIEMTEEQITMIELIYKDRTEQIHAIEVDEELSDGEKKAAILQVKNEADADIREELTTGQLKKYNDRKAAIKARRLEEKAQDKLGKDAIGDLYESDI